MNWNLVLKLIRNCLSRIVSRQFHFFLIFLFISTTFWLLLALNDKYEQIIPIKLELVNVPQNVVITTDLPESIQVNLQDKGFNLLNYIYGNKINPIEINFTQHIKNKGHVILPLYTIKKSITQQLTPSTTLASINPDTLEYFFNYGSNKRIPIKFQGQIKAKKTYYVSNIKLMPDSTIVYASKSILDTIKAAYISPIFKSELKDTTIIYSSLETTKGIKFIPSTVKVFLTADQYTEKTICIPITSRYFPKNKILRTFPSKVNITFQVGLSKYKNIDPNDFDISINYNDLIYNKSDTYTLKINRAPENIRHIRIYPQKIDYIIEEINDTPY